MKLRISVSKLLEEQKKDSGPPGKDSIPVQTSAERERKSKNPDFDIARRKRAARVDVVSNQLQSISNQLLDLDKDEIIKKAKELARPELNNSVEGNPGSAGKLGEMKLYLDIVSDKRILRRLLSAAAAGPDAYKREIYKLENQIEKDKLVQAIASVGSVAGLELIDLASAGILKSLVLGGISGTAEYQMDKMGILAAISQWNKENFNQFLIGVYPLLVANLEADSRLKGGRGPMVPGKGFSQRDLRQDVNELVQGNVLGDFVYDPPSYFPFLGSSPGGFEKVDDSVEVFRAISGLGTDEKTIRQVLKRRRRDLVEFYNEFNVYLAKKGESGKFEKDAGVRRSRPLKWSPTLLKKINVDNYFGDLIDWLWFDGMYPESLKIIKALVKKGKARHLPGEQPRSRKQSEKIKDTKKRLNIKPPSKP
jgi:hypothetical protein